LASRKVAKKYRPTAQGRQEERILKILTRQEELILLTVHQLGDESHLINIRQYLIENTDRDWSVSSVYVPLDRLAQIGCLNERIGDPIGKRGRRAVKYYSLSEEGKEALANHRELTNRFWEGLEGISR